MFKVMLGLVLALGSAVNALASGAADNFHLWVYNDTPYKYGYVLDNRNGSWSEVTPEGQQYHFTEKERIGIEILLYDVSRDLYVRLTPTTMLLRYGHEGFEHTLRRGIFDRRRVLFGRVGDTQVIFSLKPNKQWKVHYYNPAQNVNYVKDFVEQTRDIGGIKIYCPDWNATYYILNEGKVLNLGGAIAAESGNWADPEPRY